MVFNHNAPITGASITPPSAVTHSNNMMQVRARHQNQSGSEAGLTTAAAQPPTQHAAAALQPQGWTSAPGTLTLCPALRLCPLSPRHATPKARCVPEDAQRHGEQPGGRAAASVCASREPRLLHAVDPGRGRALQGGVVDQARRMRRGARPAACDGRPGPARGGSTATGGGMAGSVGSSLLEPWQLGAAAGGCGGRILVPAAVASDEGGGSGHHQVVLASGRPVRQAPID